MKPFTLEPSMTTLGGVFYPTGYMVLMFATEQGARAAARKLEDDGLNEDDIALASPDEFLRELSRTFDEDDDEVLPSAGTEADTARRLGDLARHGHHALIVHCPGTSQCEHLMDHVLKDTHIVYGQRYRRLIIEDLT